MGLRTDASGEYLLRTTALPASDNITMCGWTKRRSAQSGVYRNVCGIEDSPTSPTKQRLIIIRPSNVLSFYDSNGFHDFANTPAVDEWFFWALTVSGISAGNANGYMARVGDASIENQANSGSLTAFTNGAMFVHNDASSGSNDYLDGVTAAVKVWDAVLTQAELERERWSFLPQRMANLHLWSPLIDNAVAATDYSGNGKDWTLGGTLVVEDGPPIPWAPRGRRPIIAASGGGGFQPAWACNANLVLQ